MAVQNRPIGRVVAIGVAVAMSCAALVVPTMAQAQSEARTSAKKDVQVIAFQQSWNTIASVAAAGIHSRHTVVDELPAGELQT